MKNKKKLFLIVIGIAVIVFIGLYAIINYSEPNVLNSQDKKWISDNGGKVIDIDVVNNIPVYANNGSGVIFDFLDYMNQKTNLEFNKVPYLKGSTDLKSKNRVEIIDGSVKLASNQFLMYTDSYIAIEKTDRKINNLNDFDKLTIGILKEDNSTITYYLENVKGISFKTYDTIDDLFKALDNKDVGTVIIPHIINLDKTLKEGYYVNYFFNNISKNVVLTIDSDNKSLSSIVSKVYNRWYKEEYTKDYSKTLLNYYINMHNISDKTKADLLSKTYVYGYVENYPYEFSMAGHMEGITIEYLRRIVKLTNIDIKYQKYDNIDGLKKGIEKGDVDIYFDYFNSTDTKYLKSKPVFASKYVILGKGNTHFIDNLESLRGKDVSMLSNHYLTNYIKANAKANVNEKNSVDDLKKDNLIIVDYEVYNYYKNNKFKNYEILYYVRELYIYGKEYR